VRAMLWLELGLFCKVVKLRGGGQERVCSCSSRIGQPVLLVREHSHRHVGRRLWSSGLVGCDPVAGSCGRLAVTGSLAAVGGLLQHRGLRGHGFCGQEPGARSARGGAGLGRDLDREACGRELWPSPRRCGAGRGWREPPRGPGSAGGASLLSAGPGSTWWGLLPQPGRLPASAPGGGEASGGD
jgi:hypothetical protein